MTRPCRRQVLVAVRRSACHALSVASKTRLQPVGLGLVRPDDAEVRSPGWRASRRAASRPAPGWRSAVGGPGRHLDARSRGSRAAPGRAAAGRRWRAGWRPSARSPGGSQSASSGTGRAVGVEQLLGPVGAHPLPPAARGAPGSSRAAAAAPGGRARCPRPAGRRPPSGPVQPFGVRSTIIGHRGRSAAPPVAGRALDLGDLVEDRVQGGGQQLVHARSGRRRLDQVRRGSP